MSDLQAAFRSRLAALVADGRATMPDGAHICDSVEKRADAIAAMCVDDLTAAVAAVVPPDLRPVVMSRLVERIDLVPWSRRASDVWMLAFSVSLALSSETNDPDDFDARDGWDAESTATLRELMRTRPHTLSLWLRKQGEDTTPETRRVLFAEAINATIPPTRHREVNAIVDRSDAKGCDPLTVRLVAWLFLDETAPERIAVTAARDALTREKGAIHADAERELSRAVADWLPRAPSPMVSVDVVDGVHPLDEALAALLEGMGGKGPDLARSVRDTAKRTPEDRAARWRLYADPLRVPRMLALCLWDGVRLALRYADDDVRSEAERRSKVPAPAIHPAPRLLLMGARSALADSVGGVRMDGAYMPPVALASVGERALSENAGKVVVILAAYLSREVWARWVRGEDRFDYVPLPYGRAALRAIGVEASEDDLDEAIEWLRAASFGGLPCIAAAPSEMVEDKRGRGRPEKRRMIHVGAPLAPMGLGSVYGHAGMTLPPELRFFSPVMDPAQTPLVGNRQTYARQRDFFALGIGGFLVERREEYAERGGIAIDPTMWRRALQARGLYHRTHHSLAEQVFGAYMGHREPGLPGLGPRAAVLVETTPGSGVYRLGPDFADQERVIINAADVSTAARRRRQKGIAARRRTRKGDS